MGSFQELGSCDYLIVGAGAASLAFVDTLLTEQPSITVVIIDKHPAPGGHWNDAYDFVHLHQPSLLYGVSSKQLEGSWLKLMLLKGMLPWRHRASKSEILHYYREIVDSWVKSGRVRYFPNTEYDLSQIADPQKDDIHSFHSVDGSTSYCVKVAVKLVNAIAGECKIPSTSPLEFPVSKDAEVLTPNDLYHAHEERGAEKKTQIPRNCRRSIAHCEAKRTKYVVLGAGKTGMDTVVYLQHKMRVDPNDISWVIPNDVWMLNRSGGGPMSYVNALADNELDVSQACHQLEDQGIFLRLDKTIEPTRFRFPVIGKDELRLLRKVKNVIRRGRVTSISTKADGTYCMEFDRSDESLLLSPQDNHVFVHCASPGPFNGNIIRDLFVSDKMMTLYFLYAPPVPISMSCLAVLESARRKGTLDVEFGRKLLGADESLSENEVLRQLVHGYRMTDVSPKDQLATLKLLAVFLALLNPDPLVSYRWMVHNRLSFFSIPGFKSNVYERVNDMAKNCKSIGFDENEVRILELLSEKLKPLEGK